MADSKVFMIIGKSFSGKDTLLNSILWDNDFCKNNKLNRLVRYTTRKQRPNEVEGESYHFISDEEYLINYKDNENVSVTSFNSEFGDLHYITDFSKLKPDTNYITVGDPESIADYKNILGNRLCVIYLMPPDWVLFQRFSRRNDNQDYNYLKYKEIHRRFIDDMKKFGTKSNEFMAGCNCILVIGKEYSLKSIKDLMEKFIDAIEWKSMGILLTKNENILFGNKYYPDIVKSSIDESVIKGEIGLRNFDINIDTNNETYTIH